VIGGAAPARAVRAGTLEDDRDGLPIVRSAAEIALMPQQIVTVRPVPIH